MTDYLAVGGIVYLLGLFFVPVLLSTMTRGDIDDELGFQILASLLWPITLSIIIALGLIFTGTMVGQRIKGRRK